MTQQKPATRVDVRQLAHSIIDKMSPDEIERLFFPVPKPKEPSLREQCVATLRDSRKAKVLPLNYTIPARVGEMLERMSSKSALDIAKAIVRLLEDIVAQER